MSRSGQRLGGVLLPLLVGFGLLSTFLLASRLAGAPLAPTAGVRYVAPAGSDGANDCLNSVSPCATIQHATDVAASGDEVRVAAGTYSGVQAYVPGSGLTQTQVVYINKSLTVRGGYTLADWEAADPAGNPTIIDAQGQGRPVTVIGSGPQKVTLSGLTLTGGDYTDLGNPDGVSTIYCNGRGNDCGGGLYVTWATIHVEDCIIEDNFASRDSGEGGGVFLNSPYGGSIRRTVIRNNDSAGLGGGLIFHDLYGPFTISDSRFEGNLAEVGGGIFVRNGIQDLLTIENSQFVGNVASSGYGGGAAIRMTNDGTILVMDRVIFQDNQAQEGGKALFLNAAGAYAPRVRLTNLLLTGNSHAPGKPDRPEYAVISIDTGSPADLGVSLAHVTAVSNTVDTFLYAQAYGGSGDWPLTVSLTNTLLADFINGFAAEEEVNGVTTLIHDHTLFQNVPTQTWVVDGAPSITTLNPLSGDPKLDAGFRLQSDSAAIDVGLDVGLAEDIDGQFRPQGAAPDVGADEFLELVGPASLVIGGPTSVVANEEATFTAEVGPINATRPMTYVWSATGLSDVVHAGRGPTDTVTFSWPTAGAKEIGLTVFNEVAGRGEVYPVSVISAPALSIEKSGPAEAISGSTITYTLTVSNAGLSPASNVIITDLIPANVIGVTPLDSGQLSNGLIQWNLAELGASSSTQVRFQVSANQTIVNENYGVAADGGYGATGTAAVTTVFGQPQLSLTKTGPKAAPPGQPIQYDLTVDNSGNIAATNVIVSDTLPAGATYVSGGTLVGNVVRWKIANVPGNGGVAEVSFTVTADDNVVNSDYELTADGGFGAQGAPAVITAIGAGTRYVATGGSDGVNNCLDSASPCGTIQHAVDLAFANEEVRVAAGTYSGIQVYTPTVSPGNDRGQYQVVYIDKSLTVRGGYTTANWDTANPAANPTIVDAQGQGRPVTVIRETSNQAVTLSGLTLTGGDYTDLGNPNNVSTIFCNGQGDDCGGGLYVFWSTIHLEDCLIEGNFASKDSGEGGGIYLKNVNGGSIQRTVIRNNDSAGLGGGLGFHDLGGPFTISGSRFEGNLAEFGGGIFVRNGIQNLLTIEDSQFVGNVASNGYGGGAAIRMTNDGTILVMDRVTFQDNQAQEGGKALFLNAAGGRFPRARLTNLLLTGNGHAPGQPDRPEYAVISIDTGSAADLEVSLAHVTAADNAADTFLYAQAYGGNGDWPLTVTLTNTLLADFVNGFAAEQEAQGVTTLIADHTLYHNVPTQTWVVDGTPSVDNLTPLSGDPKLSGTFRLLAGSAALDAGIDAGVAHDLDGQARPYGSAPDIGADERVVSFAYLPLVLKR